MHELKKKMLSSIDEDLGFGSSQRFLDSGREREAGRMRSFIAAR
jgi:hypothetical protein